MADSPAREPAVLVVWTAPGVQIVLRVMLDAPMTIGDAIAHSDILAEHPEIDLAVHRVGVFGKFVSLDAPARGGDRIEIYRPLIADPKESRRRRAARKNGKS